VAFLLREAFEADYASIAKILDRSAAHCRQIVHRAKDRVRDHRKSIDATHTAQGEDAIAPLLDAIARQDVNALVALTLVTASMASPDFATTAPVAPASATAIAEQQAAQLTHALIARLRIGRIDLPSTVARERTSLLVLA
jgi:RNA polymerase sigma-70 factor (ECF subfamily)